MREYKQPPSCCGPGRFFVADSGLTNQPSHVPANTALDVPHDRAASTETATVPDLNARRGKSSTIRRRMVGIPKPSLNRPRINLKKSATC